jgi:hypothetical protein
MVHGRVVTSGIGIEDVVNKDIEGCRLVVIDTTCKQIVRIIRETESS